MASETIGVATNNVAEYRALTRAIQLLVDLGADEVDFYLDSQLIVRQMEGEYRVKDPKMKVLYEEAQKGLRHIKAARFHHVGRDENRRADALANLALDRNPVG